MAIVKLSFIDASILFDGQHRSDALTGFRSANTALYEPLYQKSSTSTPRFFDLTQNKGILKESQLSSSMAIVLEPLLSPNGNQVLWVPAHVLQERLAPTAHAAARASFVAIPLVSVVLPIVYPIMVRKLNVASSL